MNTTTHIPLLNKSAMIQKQKDSFVPKDKRYIFILKAGTDLTQQSFDYCHLDLNLYLNRMIPEKIFSDRISQQLGIFEQLNLAAPSYAL